MERAARFAAAVTLGVLVFTLRSGSGHSANLELSHGAGIFRLLAANLYVFAFGVSWGPCVWILLSEMFPNSIRGSAMAVAAFAQWVANWAITVSFPRIVTALGPSSAYGMYMLFAVVSFVFVQRFIAETRARALEEM